MGKPVFITDPAVAAQYAARPGEWFYVADDAEADWLVEKRHAHSLTSVAPLPAPGAIDPAAPSPFVPYGTPTPAPTRKAKA